MKPMTLKAAFRFEPVTLLLEKLLPSKKLTPGIKATPRYKMIEASVRAVGVIEPPMVHPQKGKAGIYVLLDGHVRVEILRDMGETEVICLVSIDDENATFNEHVSRIAPIQESRMLQTAVDEGVPEARIAEALNMKVGTIRGSRSRLLDISPDAIEVLKDKHVAVMALAILKKVKPYRQVEMAELMVMSNTYSAPYAKALLAATAADQLVDPPKPETKPEQIAKLENEMRTTERDFAMVEESYSRDTLNLQLACAYLKTLLRNARVARHLGQHHAELLAQLEKVVEVTSLEA
jgi:hypothetical protein